MSDAARIDQQYVWHPFTPMREWTAPGNPPLVIARAEGAELIDEEGNRYLDGNASIWTNVHGHGVAELTEALTAQLRELAHCSALGLANAPAAFLARDLVEALGQGCELRVAGDGADSRPLTGEGYKVFYSDDGSTAVEAGLKMMHQARVQRGESPKRSKLISLGSSYHGDTIGAMSAGHSPLFHRTYKDLLFETEEVMRPVCYRCPYNRARPEKGAEARRTRRCHWECLDQLDEVLDREGDSVSALVLEPRVQGPGGMAMMPDGYLKGAAERCRDRGIWLMLDEVMTGFGRTGSLFACQKEAVIPDVLALGKGMTGGLFPMAATLASREIYDAFLGDYEEMKTFFHGHSYTGNPLGAALSRKNLERLQERGLQEARQLGEWLDSASRTLWEVPHVGEVRREGTILAVELVEEFASARPFPWQKRVGHHVCLAARSYGLITRPIGDVLVLMLPFCATQKQVERAVRALVSAICDVVPSQGTG